MPAAPDHEHQSNLRCLGVGGGGEEDGSTRLQTGFAHTHTHTHMFVSARTWSAELVCAMFFLVPGERQVGHWVQTYPESQAAAVSGFVIQSS